MSGMRKGEPESAQQLIENVKNKQRNTIWPEALNNSRDVDEFLWKGAPDAPLVQRVGAWLFGMVFVLVGVGWFAAGYARNWWIFCLLSFVWFFVGVRVFLNGFRKHRRAHECHGKET